jgi:hypothetical protein
MNYYVQLRSRFITSFIWFSFLGAAQFHSKVSSFQDCMPSAPQLLFVHFIFPCQIHSLCVHLVSTCQNQKSVDINLLTRLIVHCLLEPLFVRTKPDNIFIACSCHGYGCIVAGLLPLCISSISCFLRGIKFQRTNLVNKIHIISDKWHPPSIIFILR